MDGWVKVHRKMLDWGWYADPNTKAVFLHLLLTANYQDTTYRGMTVHAGQTVIGRKALAEKLGMSEQNVRTALNRLKSTNEITIEVTNKFSVVTLVNWDLYQLDDDEVTNESTNKLTNNQPTTNQQLTSNQPHLKKERNKESKKERIDIYSRERAEIIGYLNEICGTNYRPNSRTTKGLIQARMNDGYTVDDFKTVIYKKAKQWKNDARMCQYLRPETLFGSKFEGYLNEKAALTFEERLAMA